MRDIRDPESPYREQYTEFDYWCYANAADMESADYNAMYSGGGTKEVLHALVDDAGYIVPQLAEQAKQYASYYAESESAGDGGCDKSFAVWGELPDELRAQYLGAQARAIAAHLPRIPDWLAAAPPRLAVLLDDGELVVGGDLGSGRDEFELNGWLPEDEQLTWHRYTPAGELVSDGRPGDDWQALFMENYPTLKAREADGRTEVYCAGEYVMVYQYDPDNPSSEVDAEIYDYHGNQLPITFNEIDWRKSGQNMLNGGMLQLVHACQQQAPPAAQDAVAGNER